MARAMTTTATAVCRRVKPIGSQHRQVAPATAHGDDQRVGQREHGDRSHDGGDAGREPAELLEVLHGDGRRLRVGLEPRRQELGELGDVLARARPPPPRR